ncbi:NAD(P)-dependent dehydrogenase, short-chain alcohol dehydrogenase family [Zunongwangia mangrovi]|uniref:NAD(P)-dependent dehydrogenase, short-chain alcohol dehydrogenase family n=1 Tax=Zunongwangia mangrovi TaxID=1334022 RepID=A0A1I1JBY7_9FLAO|nr:SDR family oxidoreductase [Zunongwangia mangrovi]SFC46087.1 NAD(P)-dependent dehydrogenase, short-chain alcohol dehydrogenase family [Zunongwangia mangrovi]
MRSEFNLANKNVVITGGASGIGEAIAKKFISHGAQVFVIDLNFESFNIKTETITFMSCDVSKYEEVKNVFLDILKNNSIDILVNNAGIAHVGNLENTTEEDFDRIYKVNVKGIFNCSKAVLSHFKKKNEGVILNMASIASVVGIQDRFAYSMSKGAVLTMTYSIAKDYVNNGIRCNCISPARVHTPFVDSFIRKNYPNEIEDKFEELSKTQPLGRMGKPEEIANLALYLCSDEAAFVTGTNFPIDGGFIKLNG